MTGTIVDTNVAIAANGRETHADEMCQLECIRTLRLIVEHGVVIVDNTGLILDEYRGNLRPAGQPGVGDYFYKHLLDLQYDERYCQRVTITPTGDGGFEEFPNDPALARFDRKDRKFVAAAFAAGEPRPTILNATDTDWWEYELALDANGILVRQLCPQHGCAI